MHAVHKEDAARRRRRRKGGGGGGFEGWLWIYIKQPRLWLPLDIFIHLRTLRKALSRGDTQPRLYVTRRSRIASTLAAHRAERSSGAGQVSAAPGRLPALTAVQRSFVFTVRPLFCDSVPFTVNLHHSVSVSYGDTQVFGHLMHL